MDADDKMMVVYEHKTKGRKIIPGGLTSISELDLIMATSAHEDIIIRKKTIKPGSTTVDILKTDLMSDDEKAAAVKKSKKIEEVPWKTFLGHEFENHGFEELTIVALQEKK